MQGSPAAITGILLNFITVTQVPLRWLGCMQVHVHSFSQQKTYSRVEEYLLKGWAIQKERKKIRGSDIVLNVARGFQLFTLRIILMGQMKNIKQKFCVE